MKREQYTESSTESVFVMIKLFFSSHKTEKHG